MPLRGATVEVGAGALTGVAVTPVAVAVGPMVAVGTAGCTCDIGVARDDCVATVAGVGFDVDVGVAVGGGVDVGVAVGGGVDVGSGVDVGVAVGGGVDVGVAFGGGVDTGVDEVATGVSKKRKLFA